MTKLKNKLNGTASKKGYRATTIKVEPMVDGISVELPFLDRELKLRTPPPRCNNIVDADCISLEFQLAKESADELYNKLGFALQDMDEHIDEYIESVKGLEPPFK